MNITPRIKSARNRNNLIVNVSIQIPLKQKFPISHRSQQTSISPSPNRHKKKYKLISSSTYQKKTLNTSNLNTMRDVPFVNVEHPPSRKKYSNPTPFTAINQSTKATFTKFKSCDLSPKRKGQTSRKGKESKITRNISILERTINEQDNIIKYTTNSNQIKDKSEDFILIQNLARKIDTHISEIDITQIRNIQNSARDNKERHYRAKINDILRTASAKKIQRAWRNYKTKKLIRCYSNDIRNKYLRNINISQEPLLTVRSQGMGLKFKKKLPDYAQISAREAQTKAPLQIIEQKPDKNSKIVKKIQQDSMQKWEVFLQQIKNKKNLNAVLQFSLQRTKQLKQQLGKDLQKESQVPPSPSPSVSEASSENKIIKTKKYYESQRQKWRESIERSNGSIIRQQRVNYFQNEMLRLQNDESESDSSLVHSFDIDNSNKELQQIQNIKLRKKLQIFRNHLPQIGQSEKQKESSSTKPLSNRIDIATIIRKKNQSLQKPIQSKPIDIQTIIPKHTVQVLEFDINEDIVERQFSNNSSQEIIDTHREYRPFLHLQQKEENGWKQRLKQLVKTKDEQTVQVVFEELILEALIQISDSEKLISFIKNIYDQKKASPAKKAEGILTNHASIKEYINFFINYLYQYQMQNQIHKNLLKPVGPSARDVLKYFRGEEITYDPESEYVMGIKIFNSHWEYSNDLIYFDKKWEDEQKQAQRVNYLKQLTKVFFRAIFDCFNQSLESQRIYGMRGKPYPWSAQRLNVQAPTLKKSLSFAFQRVLRYSLIFAGVLFKDKHHNLDDKTIEDVQQSNMVKLITIEMKDEEPLWLFLEDELAEIKLQIAQYVEDTLLKEVTKIVRFGWNRIK